MGATFGRLWYNEPRVSYLLDLDWHHSRERAMCTNLSSLYPRLLLLISLPCIENEHSGQARLTHKNTFGIHDRSRWRKTAAVQRDKSCWVDWRNSSQSSFAAVFTSKAAIWQGIWHIRMTIQTKFFLCWSTHTDWSAQATILPWSWLKETWHVRVSVNDEIFIGISVGNRKPQTVFFWIRCLKVFKNGCSSPEEIFSQRIAYFKAMWQFSLQNLFEDHVAPKTNFLQHLPEQRTLPAQQVLLQTRKRRTELQE